MAYETTEKNSEGAGDQQATAGIALISIKSIPLRSYARDLRLREDDVIVAIDGVPLNVDIAEFEELLLDARDDETEVFVTIARDQMFFEIFIAEPLGVTFARADTQQAADIMQRFTTHHVGSKSDYETYEALRDVHRHVTVYSTTYSGLATTCPPLWLIQNRALEPFAGVIAAYAAAAAVHWIALFVTIFLVGLYFHRIQFRIIRNYNIFTEHFYWLVFAARTITEAQKICREIDPKCSFSFSYVGPPQDAEPKDKRTSRRASRKVG